LELLKAKLGHLAAEQRQEIENAMQEENVIATSIHDLRPAEVHYEHSF
jgi:anti-sigma-K factor RskA